MNNMFVSLLTYLTVLFHQRRQQHIACAGAFAIGLPSLLPPPSLSLPPSSHPLPPSSSSHKACNPGCRILSQPWSEACLVRGMCATCVRGMCVTSQVPCFCDAHCLFHEDCIALGAARLAPTTIPPTTYPSQRPVCAARCSKASCNRMAAATCVGFYGCCCCRL